MNVLAFVAFLLALILLVIGLHHIWVLYLFAIGGLLLSTGAGSGWIPWRH